MEELIQWTENSPFPLLIKSCVFHYEFEVIHPFAERQWAVLDLPLAHTAAVKMESLIRMASHRTIIHLIIRPSKYYAAINQSNAQGEGTILSNLCWESSKRLFNRKQSMNSLLHTESKRRSALTKIAAFLRTNYNIQNVDVQNLLDVSPATASRVLNTLTKEGKLVKVRNGRYWAYKLAD